MGDSERACEDSNHQQNGTSRHRHTSTWTALFCAARIIEQSSCEEYLDSSSS
jgi:hypothetical protein